MPAPDPEAQQLSRQAMAELLDRELPQLPPAHREAALSGTVIELASGKKYQAPITNSPRPTHHATLPLIEQDPSKWN